MVFDKKKLLVPFWNWDLKRMIWDNFIILNLCQALASQWIEIYDFIFLVSRWLSHHYWCVLFLYDSTIYDLMLEVLRTLSTLLGLEHHSNLCEWARRHSLPGPEYPRACLNELELEALWHFVSFTILFPLFLSGYSQFWNPRRSPLMSELKVFRPKFHWSSGWGFLG